MELVSIEVTRGKIAEMLFLMTLIHIYPRGSGFEFGKDKTTQSSCWAGNCAGNARASPGFQSGLFHWGSSAKPSLFLEAGQWL